MPDSALIDAVIAVTMAEGLALAAYHWRTGRGLPPRALIANLGAGLALMLALRAALTGAGAGWVAAALLLSGVLHAADLRARWGREHRP